MKRQKIKYIIISVVIIAVIVAIVLCVKFWGKNKEEVVTQVDKKILLEDYCWSEVIQYEVEDTNEDGMTTVSVSAPDFSQLAENLMEEEKVVTEEALLDTMLNTSVDTRTYSFRVEDTTEEVVKEAFYEQVVYELIIEAIKNIEYTEEWSVDE